MINPQSVRREPTPFESLVLDYIEANTHKTESSSRCLTPSEIADIFGQTEVTYAAIAFLTMNGYVNARSGYIWKISS